MIHFRLEEFACRCNSLGCDAAEMREAFLLKLDELRELWGKPLIVTSGARCRYWNQVVGGVPGSRHLLGDAADLKIESREEAVKLADLAESLGFRGIGIAKNFIHLDLGIVRRWEYP